ncbi:FG-GAP repeat domain-containing protein [Limnoglobus roseus]|uniref:VCBS repeat-containing protein n=1 Tax=Limnoglobus roseus TaxID=2598579 RepID=A0A5C1APJ3_9BACT|nr:VCBS repeat-containing protein [Limnoglobus roseus]QEL18788.1 VCBS repeat-containing protein [Limnoglobus roseus]
MVLANITRSTRLNLESLDRRDVPATLSVPSAAHAHRFAVASAAGQTTQVNVYESGTNALLTTFQPFGQAYTGGVSVATGDVTGDGIDDVVVGALNGSSRVKIYDGATQAVVANFETHPGTTAGAFVALGDVTGDGRIDLVVGANRGSIVQIYRGQDLTQANPTPVAQLQPFGAPYNGGVRVAVGDVNGDHIADIIAAPGVGGSAVVNVYTTTAAWGDTPGSMYRSKLSTISVGGTGDRGGVFVSAADMDGDGKADIAVGRVVSGRATVTVYKGDRPQVRLLQSFGYTSTEPGGVPVSLRDLDGDGHAELIVGGGAGTSQVRVLNRFGALERSFMAFPPNYQGGVFVG